jgi:uncharacterized protein (DUF885 family)
MSMQLSRRDFGLSVGGALLGSTMLRPVPAAAQTGLDRELTAYLDAQYEAELAMDPMELTAQGRKDQYDQLTDGSEAAELKRLEWRRRSVAEMKRRFDPARLSDDARVSFDMWALELERAEEAYRWRGHGYTFARGGYHTRLPNFMINQHRVDTPADMEAYIRRVSQIGPALDVQLERAKAAAATGVRMPRFSYEQSAQEVTRLTAGAPFDAGPDSALFADGKAKIAGLKLSQAESERLAAWLAADVANTTPDARGAGALPDGAAFYEAMLRLQTTTSMTAEQIHELGLAEVKRIRGEMEALKARIGFTGALEEFFVFMRTDDRFYVSDDDAGRARYLKIADDYLAGMYAALPRYFARIPKTPLVVKRVESFREEPGGAAHYYSGAPDGSRPGIFYVHLADVRATPIYEIEGTCYHEGWPGHHMQIMLAQEMTGTLKFRGQYGYGAYIEGWGLYVEQLAKEAGFYTDPYSDFGRLGREIWRAIRLVVDTGIHAKGWSEEQALEFYSANSPQPMGKIRSEIRRYFVNPGQATSYKVGMVRILELREMAKRELGPRFDLKAFHETVLGAGSLPLNVLEARVGRWIASAKAA